MRWFSTKDLRSTITAIFSVSTAPPPTPRDQVAALEAIRQRMLELAALGQAERRSEAVARRIRFAANVESLWFARGELMGQLARAQGEAAARAQVDALRALFEEVLPKGLRSRPSRFNGEAYRSSRFGAGEG
jgi:hypothetical protein